MTTDVWEIPPESATRVGHPAPFPVELPQRLIELYTYRDDLVLDPFMGSGTTAIAAMRTDRHYVGYDTEESYIALAEERIAERARRVPRSSGARSCCRRSPSPPGTTRTRWPARCARARRPRTSRRPCSSSAGSARSTEREAARGRRVVNFAALDADDAEWWFDVSGAFTSARPGLQRTDTLWKALGKAAVVFNTAIERRPYVLLTTDAPRKGTAGAKALAVVQGPDKPVHDVIELLNPADWERLKSCALGVVRPS